MEDITILHLSDLHYDSTNEKDMQIVLKALFSDFEKMQETGIKPEIVIFSGDIINAGDSGYSNTQNDYDKIGDILIEPILKIFGLATDNFYICPGNHDIQRKKVHNIIESGISNTLTDRAKVNSFIDRYEDFEYAFARMENYDQFKNSLINSNCITSNFLYSTYKFTKLDKQIGIACINSAWNAYGGDKDYGKLLIGERTVDNCIEDLRDCELRIAVIHHPFDYLCEFEKSDIKRLIYGAFNLLFMGHYHEPECSTIEFQNENRIAVISGGALYKCRDFYNGYSIISFSLSTQQGKVYMREYIDRKRGFGPSVAYTNEDGYVPFSISKSEIKGTGVGYSLSTVMRDKVPDQYRNALLSAGANSSVAPKDLEKIFVEPPLYKYSEYKIREIVEHEKISLEKTKLSFKNISESDDNFLFIGIKECGKTTLLNYLHLRFLFPFKAENVKIPIYINFKNLPKGNNRIEKAFLNYLADYHIAFDFDEFLMSNSWVMLVDDLDTSNIKSVNALREFMNIHQKNRYFMTLDEDILEDIRDDKPIELPIDYDKVYIHAFRRKETRNLVEKWFSDSQVAIVPGDMADLILDRISEINLTRTPLIISMMLMSFEKRNDYYPLNKSALMQNIIAILLEKIYPDRYLSEELDYRNVEDYLSYLAQYFVENEIFQLSIDTLKNVTQEYFQRRGLTLSSGIGSFVEYIINCGIFSENKRTIQFRFKGFYEFFVAKQMIENIEFYEYILRKENYLDYANSIDYLTGLQRKNKELITKIHERSERNFHQFISELGMDINDLDLISGINTYDNDSQIETEDGKVQLVKTIKSSKLSEDTKDKLSDTVFDIFEKRNDEGSQDNNFSPRNLESALFENLILYSRVIRNCELIDDIEFKRENTRNCVSLYSKFITMSIKTLEDSIDSISDEELRLWNEEYQIKINIDEDISSNEYKSIAKSILKPFIYIILDNVLNDALGTSKLQKIFEFELEQSTDNLPERVLYVLIYLDLKIPGYLDKIESLVNEIMQEELYRDILSIRLLVHYMYETLSRKEYIRIENILKNLYIKKKGLSKYKKSKLMKHLPKKRETEN